MTAAVARDPLAVYGAVLRRAATGTAAELRLIDPAGRRAPMQLRPADWCARLRPGDTTMLDLCLGPTLDIGCGPGRLTAALTDRHLPALGIDISAEAVRQARRRGGRAEVACVLTTALEPHVWRHALLADGNIGIGGDPIRLLRRCRDLLTADGDVLVELAAPGTGSWAGPVALGYRGALSAPFGWAVVAVDDIARIAYAATMSVAETWTEAGRWFARLTQT